MKFRQTLSHSVKSSYLKGMTKIDCELGVSPYGHSILVDEAMQNLDLKALTAYHEVYYDTHLMIEIIKKWGGFGILPENVFMGHGIFNIVERIIHKLLDNTGMLGFGPQFNEIPSEMGLAGGKYDSLKMSPEGKLPLDEMVQTISEKGDEYSLVFIDNPVNPLGWYIPLDNLRAIIGEAEKRDLCVLVDEAYGDFVPDDHSAISLVPEFKNLIVTRSFSKAYGLASLRVGYAVISSEIVPYYRKVDVPFEPSITSGIAATAAMKDPDFIDRLRTNVQHEKTVMIDGLQKLGFQIMPTHPDVSIFLAHKPDTDIVSLFERASVSVVSGETFTNTNPSIDRSYARVRVPGHEELAKEVLYRLKELV